MSWELFISKIKPDGKAFRNISFTKHLFDTLAFGLNLIKEYAVYTLSDQVWYVNSNFDPAPWEARYEIEVPELATLDERREVVKAYMLYPQSQNRLSKDFIKNTLIDAGFTGIDIEYNPTGLTDGYLRANDFGDEKLTFDIGSLIYNSFIISGEVTASYYYNCIVQALGLKPLQVAMYDKLEVLNAIALDDDFAIAFGEYYLSQFGSTGSGDGQFNNPIDVSVNSTNVYVLDFTNNNVQKFDLDGNFVSKFGSSGTGNGQFTSPSGIAVNESNIFVVDTSNRRIQIFDLDGVYVSQFGTIGTGDGQFQIPRGIALNNTNLFIVDAFRDDVQIFDLAGNFVSKFGSSGTGDGQFQNPYGISVNSNNIFVADSQRNNVQKFDLSGVFVSKFGTTGSGDGQFQDPSGITVDDNYIYVSDITRDDIQKFDLDGVFISKFGETGINDGEFDTPVNLRVIDGILYVCDQNNDRIQMIDYNNYAIALTVL